MRTATRTALASIALVAAPALAAAQGRVSKDAVSSSSAPNATEQAIVRAVDAHNAEHLTLLERIVNVNSGTMNFAGVKHVAELLRAPLESLGFRTRWVDGAAFKRAGHLVAEHAGPGPKLLLIGHLDTVFEPTHPFQKFERIDDATARGPGVIDMKGGDVIIIAALRALKDAGALDGMNVTIVYHGDEEDAGAPLDLARRTLVDAAQGAAAAIGFEDGPGDPHVAVISRRGAGGWKLEVTGVAAHSGQLFQPEVGAGAVYETSRILNAFYEKLSKEQYLTFNPGLALGGTSVSVDSTYTTGHAEGKSNVVSERMIVSGDLRTFSPPQLAHAKQAMTEIVTSGNLPKTKATITFDDGYPPMAPTDGNKRLLAMYDRVSRDLGFWPVGPVDPSRAGAADVSFVAHIVPMAIDGVGLSGRDDHTEHETADLRMLPVQTKRAAVLMYRLTHGITQ